MAGEIASRYAAGLFLLARENKTVREKKEQAELILTAVREQEEVLSVLEAVRITDEEKKRFLERSFGTIADRDFLHFLWLLVDKNRGWYLPEILRAYIAMADEALGIQRAEVISARKLPPAELERIRDTLARKTGKEIVLVNHVDPRVIAGIKVVIGNRVTDVTMLARMEQMKRAMLEGGRV